MTSSDDSYRDAHGRFIKGNPGNPTGRAGKDFWLTGIKRTSRMIDSEKITNQAEDIITAALPEALMRLVDLIHSDDENVALQASLAIVEKKLGKPKQTQEQYVVNYHESL